MSDLQASDLRGSYVALITPFDEKGNINEKELERIIEFQIENGTAGIVPVGTTGESPTLTWEEHKLMIKLTVEIVNKRVSVIAGTGSNNTLEAIEATEYAQKVGADGVLIVAPYYNKPTQRGIYEHYKKIAEAVDIGIIIYNIPGRTGINITPETIEKLAEIKNIIGLKAACGDLNQMSDVIVRCGDKITLLSGDDTLTLPVLSIGGKGVISVLANIVPNKMAKMIDLFLEGNISEAIEIHKELFKLGRAMFIETNPIPIKKAMEILGWKVGKPRLPLVELSKENEIYLRNILKEMGLIQ